MSRRVAINCLTIVAAAVFASPLLPRRDEPAKMKLGEIIYVNDQSCRKGYVRRVSVSEEGVRKRVCVKRSYFPVEIYGNPIR